jgi:ATP-dependent DNA helicase RecQ
MGGRYPSAEELRTVYRTLEELSSDDAVLLSNVASHSGSVARTKVKVALSLLKEAGIVRERRGGRFTLPRKGISGDRLVELAAEWEQRAEADREKLERMEAYARSALCRWRVLHTYFGAESDDERCGVCDNCRRGLAAQADRPVEPAESTATEECVADTGAKLDVGDRVILPKHGRGRITAVDGDAVIVTFPDGRSRKFKREFARPAKGSAQNR